MVEQYQSISKANKAKSGVCSTLIHSAGLEYPRLINHYCYKIN